MKQPPSGFLYVMNAKPRIKKDNRHPDMGTAHEITTMIDPTIEFAFQRKNTWQYDDWCRIIIARWPASPKRDE